MHVKVKFSEGFKDGNIFPDRSFSPGDVAVLSQAQAEQVRNSGGVFEVLENVIPNPLKREPEVKKEPNDPLNAKNEINDLEAHVPGTEDEVAAVKNKGKRK